MSYIKFELKKLKGSGIVLIGLILSILVIAFQGYACLKTETIKTELMHITALNLYSGLVFPVFLSLIVIRSFYHEFSNNGFTNYYYNNISLKEMYMMKVVTADIIGITWFIMALLFTSVFIIARKGNPVEIYAENIKFILIFIVGIMTVVNLTSVMCMIFENQIIPIAISLTATVFESMANVFGIGVLEPWSYFELSFYYRGLGYKFIIIIIVCILSFVGTIFLIKKVQMHIIEKKL